MHTILLLKRFCIWLPLVVILHGCSSEKAEPETAGGPLKILATTGMIGDAISNIVGDEATVDVLMGPGVDPHLYKTTHGDLERLESADIIVYNGLHLEGKMGDVLEQMGKQKPVIALGELMRKTKLRSATKFDGAYDPHLWFDVSLWARSVKYLRDTLQNLKMMDNDVLSAGTRSYTRQLDSLDDEIKLTLAAVPMANRVLVTAHDAFGYFGSAYNFEVRGIQGLSTMSEFGLRDRVDLVDMLVRRNIKAIFVETSVSRQAIDAVIESAASKGHELKIGGQLYSDAMGEPGTPEGTYIGMLRANAKTIAAGLQ